MSFSSSCRSSSTRQYPFPTRPSSDLPTRADSPLPPPRRQDRRRRPRDAAGCPAARSEEHTSELQSLRQPVCRLLLEQKEANPVLVALDLRQSAARSRELVAGADRAAL